MFDNTHTSIASSKPNCQLLLTSAPQHHRVCVRSVEPTRKTLAETAVALDQLKLQLANISEIRTLTGAVVALNDHHVIEKNT